MENFVIVSKETNSNALLIGLTSDYIFAMDCARKQTKQENSDFAMVLNNNMAIQCFLTRYIDVDKAVKTFVKCSQFQIGLLLASVGDKNFNVLFNAFGNGFMRETFGETFVILRLSDKRNVLIVCSVESKVNDKLVNLVAENKYKKMYASKVKLSFLKELRIDVTDSLVGHILSVDEVNKTISYLNNNLQENGKAYRFFSNITEE